MLIQTAIILHNLSMTVCYCETCCGNLITTILLSVWENWPSMVFKSLIGHFLFSIFHSFHFSSSETNWMIKQGECYNIYKPHPVCCSKLGEKPNILFCLHNLFCGLQHYSFLDGLYNGLYEYDGLYNGLNEYDGLLCRYGWYYPIIIAI